MFMKYLWKRIKEISSIQLKVLEELSSIYLFI